jgi:Ca2+/Na+ antiporter
MAFFIFELVFAGYLLLNLALIAEHFLMPSLLRIAKRYRLSRDVTGIVVAVGNSVPELTTTILSFMKHGVKMTEFGVASNIGCAVLTITVVPALAILATLPKRGDEVRAAPVQGSKKQQAREAQYKQRVLMLSVYRDLGFFLMALVIYDLVLLKGTVYFYEAVLLLALLGLYAASIVGVNSYARTLE